MSAVEVLEARLGMEEGERILPYDDATGLTVRAPKGNLSWGIGFNLMACGSHGLFLVMRNYLIGQLDQALQSYGWYTGSGDARGSVFLDIAYNGGLHDLLNYPHMLAAAALGDWPTAAANCTDKDPKLDASRYAPLRKILLTGEA